MAQLQPGRSLQVWWRSFRYHFTPPSFLPAALGAIVAWAYAGSFSLWAFALVVVVVTLNHFALNMTDDYYDYKHSVDSAEGSRKNPYSGGSGTLTSGEIAPRQMRAAFFALYLVTCAAGILLTVTRGWPVFLFGVFGVLSAYFYTAPPIRYAYRGFGELSQLLNFSLVIGLGSYFVQARSLSWEPVLATLPLGFMMFSMITVNEIPDADEDSSGGKKTLVVRFGRKTGVRLYGLGLLLAYAVILVTPLAGFSGFWIYGGLLTLPLALRAYLILRRSYQSPSAMAPANLITIQVHNLTGFLLIAAYVVRGAVAGRNPADMILPVVLVLVLYLPVAVKIFFAAPGRAKPAAG